MKAATVRIGLIGAGANTRKMHIPGFKKIPDVKMTVVGNRSEESSRKVANEFGIPATARHWREVVESPEVDAVMIGTWPYLHAEVTVAALAAGKHVLTEARMARNVEEALQMLEASRAHPDLVAQIVPAPMTLEVDAAVAEILGSGAIGEVREVTVTHTGAQYLDPDAPLAWRQDVERSGCNILSLGIFHEIVQRWLGSAAEPEWVLADGEVFTKFRKNEADEEVEVAIPDTLSVFGRTKANVRLLVHFSGVEPGLPRNEIRVNGSRGGLRFAGAENKLYQSDGSKEWEVAIPVEKRRGWRVEEDFIASIRTGSPVTLTSFEEGVQYMRFTEAVAHSWRTQQKMTVCSGPV